MLQHWFDRVDDAMALLAQAVKDPEPRVRLEAVRALSFVPTADAASTALQVLAQPMDYYLHYVLDSTMSTLEPVWKPVLTTRRHVRDRQPGGARRSCSIACASRSRGASSAARLSTSRCCRDRASPRRAARSTRALATQNGTTVLHEIIAAVNRIDGTPGSAAARPT